MGKLEFSRKQWFNRLYSDPIVPIQTQFKSISREHNPICNNESIKTRGWSVNSLPLRKLFSKSFPLIDHFPWFLYLGSCAIDAEMFLGFKIRSNSSQGLIQFCN